MNYEEARETLLKMAFAESTEFAEDRLFAFGYSDEHEALIIGVDALDKQIPKKPIATTKEKRSLGEYDDWQSCPRCKMSFGYCTRKNEVTFCPKCGQAIDWSEVE